MGDVFTEPKNTRIASSFQDYNTSSNEKEDPTQGEKSSISMGSEPQISPLVQKDSLPIEKDQSSPDIGVSLQHSNTCPISSSTSVEHVSMLTYASLTSRTSSQELTFSNASCPNTSAESLESYGVSSKLYRGSIELIKKLVMQPPSRSGCII